MKTYVLYFCFFLLAVVLVSCKTSTVQPDEESGGSLLLLISKASTPTGSFKIVVQIEHAEFPERKDSIDVSDASDTEQLQIKNVQPGTWSISISAKDTAGVEWYSAEGLVDIQKEQVSVGDVTLNAQAGGLEITIVWPVAATNWNVYTSNPVLEQTPGGFDENYFFFHDPKVLKVDGIYRMWYTSGYNESVQDTNLNWIMYAMSTDGITWTKHGPVLQPGPLESWYEKGGVLPAVLYDSGVYKMWFVGNSAAVYGAGIGYAESNDGITWSVSPDLVIVGNDSKPQLRYPEVVKKDGTYYLYYNAGILAAGALEVYLMTSTDGIQWTDRGSVLSKRNSVSWETRGVAAPGIFFEGNKFIMYYTGLGMYDESIGYAESIDGMNWLNRSLEPVITSADTSPWSITYASHPTLLKDGNTLKMWFSGLSQFPYRWEIGYAELE